MARKNSIRNTTEQVLPGAFSDVLRLLRSCLYPERERPEDAGWESRVSDWGAVRKEMRAQAVDALPGMWLRTHTLPDAELQTAWQRDCLASQATFLRIAQAQKELLALLEENSIPAVILKGMTSAEAYPQPSLRRMGDIDFLVRREDYDRANRLLEENGFRPEENQDIDGHHAGYSKNGIEYECHRRFGSMSRDNRILTDLLEKGMDQRETMSAEGIVFPCLPAYIHGFSLLLHINHHLSRTGLGLRHFLDWQMFLEKYGNEDVWEEMRPIVEATDLTELARFATSLCRNYLGLSKEMPFLPEADRALTADLLAYVAFKGNLGIKDRRGVHYRDYFSEVRDVKGFFSRLQRGGVTNWKAAQRHRLLRPFAWIYQFFLITGRLLKGKISLKSMGEDRARGVNDAEFARLVGARRMIR
ncbi:MAG: nucleotidyltransferase family protein [Lachnospiraceae bacterium]|nr:nucleotidyltransferase family protein [Lachnospiraceae bacterium]